MAIPPGIRARLQAPGSPNIRDAMNGRQRAVLFLLVGSGLGFLEGVNWGGGDAGGDGQGGLPPEQSGRARSRTPKESRPEGLGRPELDWDAKDVAAFKAPATEEERTRVARVVKAAMDEKSLPGRMDALTDLCAMMTPENARSFLKVFTSLHENGFDRPWERSIFFARYGEVMGAEAALEFEGTAEFSRIVASAALAHPQESVDWVNRLPGGPTRDMAVTKVMFGIGMSDPDYGLEVFESLAPEDQIKSGNQENLLVAFRRYGGAPETSRLAMHLLDSPEESMQQFGR